MLMGNDIPNFWTPSRMKDVPSELLRILSAFVEKMPDLPLSVHKIIEIAESDTTELDDLVQIVSSDPALVSSLLKIVNSSYYGLGRKTDNLHLAIVLLGFREVGKIALKIFMSRNLGKGFVFENYDTRSLWEHSYLVSVCAETFVHDNDEDTQKKGVFLTLGLLHDIGKFALLDIAMLRRKMGLNPKQGVQVLDSDYLLEKEEKIFGVNHSIIGGLLARKWNLSERTSSVMECHHYPSFFGINEIPQNFIEEISAVCLADLMVSKIQNIPNLIPEPHAHFFDILGLKPPIENLLTPEVKERLNKAKEFMAFI